MGDRQLRVAPVAVSMFMSYISAVLVLGNTAEVYMRGAQIYLSAFSAGASNIVSALLFVPILYPLKLVSCFEYLEMRFRRQYVKRVGTVLIIASQVIYMGIAMFAPATALAAVTTIPAWVSIVVCVVVATVYTAVGGMKAVIWTDLFQGVIYLGGIILILVVGSNQAGGISEVFRISHEHGRLNFITNNSFNPDPRIRLTLWSLVVGHFFSTLNMALRQTTVQRYSALPTQRKAMWSVLLNVPPLIIMYTLTCMCGLVVFAYYTKRGCDPLRSGEIKNPNQLLPYFVVNVLKTPGIPGMFLAVLFSGALSTVSSSLNSLSAVTWKDFLEARFPHISETRKTLITKATVLVYGVASGGMAFFAAGIGGHVMMATQSFAASVIGPMAAMFYLGIFLPCATALGAALGAFGGVGFGMWIAIGGYLNKPHRSYLPTVVANCTVAVNASIAPIPTNPTSIFPLYQLSYMLYSVFAILAAIVIGVIVSLVTGRGKVEQVDPQLRFRCAQKYCCGRNKRVAPIHSNEHQVKQNETNVAKRSLQNGIDYIGCVESPAPHGKVAKATNETEAGHFTEAGKPAWQRTDLRIREQKTPRQTNALATTINL